MLNVQKYFLTVGCVRKLKLLNLKQVELMTNLYVAVSGVRAVDRKTLSRWVSKYVYNQYTV